MSDEWKRCGECEKSFRGPGECGGKFCSEYCRGRHAGHEMGMEWGCRSRRHGRRAAWGEFVAIVQNGSSWLMQCCGCEEMRVCGERVGWGCCDGVALCLGMVTPMDRLRPTGAFGGQWGWR